MRDAIRTKHVPHCTDPSCNGLVKPEIVFFGEQLPAAFFENRTLPSQADLAIVMGTSLSVHPFASLPQFCEEGAPRLLINSEQVGEMGSRPDDVLMLEDCDSGVRKLAEACGWLEELEALWKETERPQEHEVEKPRKSRDDLLQEEVEKITRDVEDTLKLGQSQHEWLEKHVDRKIAREEDGDVAAGAQDKSDNLRPPDGEDDKRMAPVQKDEGLGHVFPHLKKPSL
jgi:NAD-dependent histone deacetylase SIR2